jgi:hypothetical protein
MPAEKQKNVRSKLLKATYQAYGFSASRNNLYYLPEASLSCRSHLDTDVDMRDILDLLN